MKELKSLTWDKFPYWKAFLTRELEKVDPRHEKDKYDPYYKFEDTLIYLDNEKIVSTATFSRRKIWLCGRSLNVGIVGHVVTDSAYRRKGLGSLMVKEVVKKMKEEGMEVSVLFCAPELYRFYGKAGGYLPFSINTIEIEIKEINSIDTNIYLEKFEPYKHLNEVEKIYNYFNKKSGAHFERERDYWLRWICPHEMQKERILWILKERENIVGYFQEGVNPRNKEEVVIGEMGYNEKGEEMLEYIILRIINFIKGLGYKKLRFYWDFYEIISLLNKLKVKYKKGSREEMWVVLKEIEVENKKIKDTGSFLELLKKNHYRFYSADHA